MMGIGFQPLADVLTHQFKKKGDAVVAENIEVSRGRDSPPAISSPSPGHP